MKNAKWAVLLGIAGLLASVPAGFAAENRPIDAMKHAPRVASAKPSPAPASSPSARHETVSGTIGEHRYAPAERMADSIAEYYASGKMRLY